MSVLKTVGKFSNSGYKRHAIKLINPIVSWWPSVDSLKVIYI